MTSTSPQTWIPERYVSNASFVSRLGAPVLELLAAEPGERVLDLGCGEGSLMLEIEAQGAQAVGADSSPELIAAARARGLDARVLDAHDLPFANEFDAVFSNAALHWMKDIGRVLSGVARALRPQGRFVAECGGAGNVEAVRSALVAELERRGFDGEARVPWRFRSVEEYRESSRQRAFESSRLSASHAPRHCPVRSVSGSRLSVRASPTRCPRASARAIWRMCKHASPPSWSTLRALGCWTTCACVSRRA